MWLFSLGMWVLRLLVGKRQSPHSHPGLTLPGEQPQRHRRQAGAVRVLSPARPAPLSRAVESAAARPATPASAVLRDLTSSTGSRLRDLENKVEFLVK